MMTRETFERIRELMNGPASDVAAVSDMLIAFYGYDEHTADKVAEIFVAKLNNQAKYEIWHWCAVDGYMSHDILVERNEHDTKIYLCRFGVTYGTFVATNPTEIASYKLQPRENAAIITVKGRSILDPEETFRTSIDKEVELLKYILGIVIKHFGYEYEELKMVIMTDDIFIQRTQK